MVAWMAVYAGASAAYLIGDYVYHRWLDKPDAVKPKPQEVNIPRTDEGAPVPIIYGRCRVRQPVLAWFAQPAAEVGSVSNGFPATSYAYSLDMYFVVGIGMNDGAATTSGFHRIWIGDKRLSMASTAIPPNAAFAQAEIPVSYGEEGPVGGQYQWYDGNAAQEHVDSGAVGQTALGLRMLTYWSGRTIPAFRNYLSVFLTNNVTQWVWGASPSVPQVSFEVSSNQTTGYPSTGAIATIGLDANPANVLWDLLKCKFGKLGIPETLLDTTSFNTAGSRLYAEGHGYSRAMEDARDGTDWIMEILRQIDAVLYEDPSDGLIKLKLIRNDFTPSLIRQITKDNCKDIVNWSMSSPSGIPNAVRVLYTDRDNNYNENSAVAKLGANATGQSNQVRWVIKQFLGCTTAATAHKIANRELAAEGHGITKCRALLDRSAYNIVPGEAVRVIWTSPDISEQIFRVAAVDRGTLTDGTVAADLISDYFHTTRSRVPQEVPFPRAPKTADGDLGG